MQNSLHTLQRIRREYIRAKGWLYTLQALAVALVGAAILYKWRLEVPLLAGLAILTIVAALVYLIWAWRSVQKTTLQQVARHLNRTYPQLEDSAGLLLRPTPELNLLERLQQQRVASQMQTAIPEKQSVFHLHKRPTYVALGIAVLVAAGIAALPATSVADATTTAPLQLDFPDAPAAVADTAVTIEEIKITVTPPAYTRRKAYQAEQPNLRVEQGARVTWRIKTNRPARSLTLVLSEGKPMALSSQNSGYTLSRTFTEPALYHIAVNGQKSAYYTLEIIPDEAPTIQITKPEQYTEILFGDPQRVTIRAELSDDYGLRDANMIATVAKGSGEAVKFREEKMSIGFSGQRRNFSVNKTIDLQKLGMTYGDELYFYVQAWDNHRGYTRSETYFVQIEDTTIVESMDDLTMGVNPVPEYFRSQRQIIIDTEKLIKEQKTLSRAVFEERGNNLGVDQKLLRLRYGKFLGEEFESGIGPGGGIPESEEGHGEEEHFAGDGHDHPEFEDETSVEALLDPYLHKHDQEEAATFFEPAVKAKLKGALAQMWEAELRLRTHRPKEALPYEYKALRMLKEVQQSTRAYAAKTGFDAPPLKEPEKRLTGDLSKIKAPTERRTIEAETKLPDTRQALQWLEEQKQGNRYSQQDVALLERAGQELAQEALTKPGRYLRAMQDLRTLIADINANRPLCSNCLITVERAWYELLPPAKPAPQKQGTTRSRLAKSYLEELED
ncbi:DUF4175 domain-containing protein [Pontibacter sp. HSC-36F09]|uniref:DUF4175 domain-containing protein n=1 Tax=Pontibacter sp. HSC-36F09 TaxID=2910966 RepID=UPI0020A0CF39|nr:DUF4175 domain-containing protein [Pontibacter sp. HSC-36F09]MCP2043092.1 hypothetical protein [Pontibacter sp. HSC-36F09]